MDTFSDFIDYLNKNRNIIRKSMKMDEKSDIYLLLKDAFNQNFHDFKPHDPENINVASTDSSEFVRMLYIGKNIVIIRAYTIYKNEISKHFIADMVAVNPEELMNFKILLMEYAEHKSIINLLDKSSPEYIFVDGSLNGRLSHSTEALKIENYQGFMVEYFRTLKEMIKKAYDKNAKLIFIAKSSYSDSFKNYLLNSIRPELLNSDPLKNEIKIYANDHAIIKAMAHSRGYTTPVMYKKILGGFDVNYVSFDVLPKVEDLPMMVHILAKDFQKEDLNEAPYNIDENIINLIFYGYTSYRVYNLWLVDVDKKVKFRKNEMENIYMRAFEKATGITFYETRGERRVRIRV